MIKISNEKRTKFAADQVKSLKHKVEALEL